MLVSCSQRKPLNWRHPRRQTLKLASPRRQTLKLALALTPTPDASQWNIGGVGPSGVGAGVGHVHFMFFVLISFAFSSQRKPGFQRNMGFEPIFHCNAKPFALGLGVGLDPPAPQFCIGDTNMLVSKNA